MTKPRRSIRSPRTGRPSDRDPLKLARLIQQKKIGTVLIVLGIILVVSLLDHGAGVLPVDNDWHRYHGQAFNVIHVVDGDTLVLDIDDGDQATTRIRLWGVNTPEMNTQSSAAPEPFAQEATDFTQRLTNNQRVTVYLQHHRLRGRYGRLLAYIELPNGTVLNAALIEQGYSKHDDRWSHDQAIAYDRLEQQARQNRRGVWGP